MYIHEKTLQNFSCVVAMKLYKELMIVLLKL